MKNVKIVPGSRGIGYFLTIGETELGVENTWAVTALELLTVEKMIGEIHSKLLEEISKD